MKEDKLIDPNRLDEKLRKIIENIRTASENINYNRQVIKSIKKHKKCIGKVAHANRRDSPYSLEQFLENKRNINDLSQYNKKWKKYLYSN